MDPMTTLAPGYRINPIDSAVALDAGCFTFEVRRS
jgi:hypothetical protein